MNLKVLDARTVIRISAEFDTRDLNRINDLKDRISEAREKCILEKEDEDFLNEIFDLFTGD